jgi:hypothetical protein
MDAAGTIQDLRKLETGIMAAIRSALFDGAEYARTIAAQTTTFKDRTGYARASIVHVDAGTFRQLVRAGGSIAPHVLFLESGTKPHIIAARNAKMLRFVQNGVVRFAKRVQHPGTKALGFMQNARDQAEGATVRFVESGISSLIR